MIAERSTVLTQALRTALAKPQERLSVDEIDLILYCRELAATDLADFLVYRFAAEGRALLWNWHLDYLCEALECQTRLEVPNLIINIPPGHLKSELASQTWHGWMIGRDESDRSSMLSASNSADLAVRDSILTRDMIQEDWYRDIFPRFGIDKRGRAKPWRKELEDNWCTPNGASRQAVGAGGKTTGKGAKRLLADDIMAASDADSEVKRESILEWWGRTFVNRQRQPEEGTKTVIMQRLHERDLTGKLLDEAKMPGGEQWEVICLPTECRRTTVHSVGDFFKAREKGELLFPALIPEKRVAALKVAMRHHFSGQYNQDPVREDGNFFKVKYLVQVDQDALELQKVHGLRPSAYMDLASKEKETISDDPDDTVIAVMARDQRGLWILDMWGDAVGQDVVADQVITMDRKWGRMIWKAPKEALKHSLAATMRILSQIRHYPVDIESLDHIPGDKVGRAQTLRALIATGQVLVPRRAPWLPTLLRWLKAFPHGAHDDWVDAPAYGAIDMEDIRQAQIPRHERPQDPTRTTGAEIEALARAAVAERQPGRRRRRNSD